MFGFSADRITDQPGEETLRRDRFEFANFSVHGPTRTMLLHDCSRPIQAQLADLRFARDCAVIDFPIDNQPAPHAAAQREENDRIETNASAMCRFAERPEIRVILDSDWPVCQRGKPTFQIKARPTFDLMRPKNPPGSPIYWTAKANSDGLDAVGGE